jgi:hypothetical protein
MGKGRVFDLWRLQGGNTSIIDGKKLPESPKFDKSHQNKENN